MRYFLNDGSSVELRVRELRRSIGAEDLAARARRVFGAVDREQEREALRRLADAPWLAIGMLALAEQMLDASDYGRAREWTLAVREALR